MMQSRKWTIGIRLGKTAAFVLAVIFCVRGFANTEGNDLRHYEYEAWPRKCCFLDKPYRDYYYTTGKWYSFRRALLEQLGERDYEMHFNRDSLTILGIEYENRIVEYHTKRHAQKLDSVYCEIIDSLSNAWNNPFNEITIFQEMDYRKDILNEVNAGCFVWYRDVIWQRDAPKNKRGQDDSRPWRSNRRKNFRLCSHPCPGLGIDHFTDYKSLKKAMEEP